MINKSYTSSNMQVVECYTYIKIPPDKVLKVTTAGTGLGLVQVTNFIIVYY